MSASSPQAPKPGSKWAEAPDQIRQGHPRLALPSQISSPPRAHRGLPWGIPGAYPSVQELMARVKKHLKASPRAASVAGVLALLGLVLLGQLFTMAALKEGSIGRKVLSATSGATWTKQVPRQQEPGVAMSMSHEELLRKLPSCDVAAEKALREYFRDIVLIVNNNYEKYTENTTSFWREYYARFFDVVVFISPNGVPSLDIEAAAEFYPDAPDPWWGTWMYQYWALGRIMRQHPEAAGFLWTNEDVVINHWNVFGSDKTKLWLPNNPEKYEYMVFELDPSAEVEEAMKGNWASRAQFRKEVKLALSRLEPKHREQYNESMLPRHNVYHKRACDLFYIPQRHGQAVLQDVLPALVAGHVVSELAIPLMFFSLDSPGNFSPVLNDMVFRWDNWQAGASQVDPRDHWNASVSAFHPWKVSADSSKQSLLDAMEAHDGCVRKRLDWKS